MKTTAKSGAKAAPKAKAAAKKPAPKTTAKTAAKTGAKTAAKTASKAAAKAPAKAAPKKAAAKKPPAKKPAAKAAPKAAAKPAGKAPAIKSAPRKAAPKKPAPRKQAGGFDLPHIDRKILAQIIDKLDEMRRESLDIINNHMQSDLKPREESSDVGDDLDQASNERDREFGLIMHQRHLRRLQQINEAFERMDEGTYGLCEGTEEPINPRRLLIMPLARYSLEFQEQQEKMLGRSFSSDTVFDSDESFSTDD